VYDVVVVYPLRHTAAGTEVLLGRKNTGLGVGRWVGPGGKVEAGESLRDAAIRELHEEVGLRAVPHDLRPIARLHYPFPTRPHLSQRSHAFALEVFEGVVAESVELSPEWWRIEDIPFELMWADAKLWLPRALKGSFAEATITIGHDDSVVDVSWMSPPDRGAE
jgi:8-oxo-dGTP diphosphatase